MRLQHDRPLRRERFRPIPVVLHHAPSTTSLSLSQTHVRAPIWRMRNWFHSPNGLSASTSGSRPGVLGVLLNRPPEPRCGLRVGFFG